MPPPDPFERMIARAAARPAAPGEPCPSADLLAASLDGTLSADERRSLEAHASRCTRCAAHLALLVRNGDGDTAAVDARPTRWWQWNWLVPVMTAVIVAVVWVWLPRDQTAQRSSEPAANAGVPTPAAKPRLERQSPAASVEPQPSAPKAQRTDAAGDRTAGPPRPGTPQAPRNIAVERTAPDEADTIAIDRSVRHDGAPTQPSAKARTVPEESSASGAAPAAAGASGTPAPAAPSGSAFQNSAPPVQAETASKDSARAKVGAPPERRAPAPLAQTAETAVTPETARFGTRARAAAAALLVSSPDPRVAWRVDGTRVEHTIDGGSTWVTEAAPAVTGLTLGSAPSAGVVWLARPDGTIVKRDANGWTTVTVAAGSALVAITAVSGTSAVVTTARGERLVTADGGASWHAAEQ